MKKELILTTALALVSMPAFAWISSSDTYSPDLLKTNGYSDTTIRMVNHERDKAIGIKSEYTQRKIIKNRVLRALYNAYVYIDPAVDSDFLDHNIDMEPNFHDL